MLDQDEYRRWRAEADNALEMSRAGTATNWQCFLAEQSAQLAMKAVLHGLGQGPWGHDLLQLGRVLAGALEQPLSGELEEALARLSRLYIATRYPDTQPGGHPGERYTNADVRQARADAEVVHRTVDDIWSQVSQ